MKLTLKEIFAQYDALKKTIDLLDANCEALKEYVARINPRAIVFTGCGSSYSLSCSFRSIASLRTELPVYAVASGDLWLNCEKYAPMLKDALVVTVSRSGQTSEVLNAFKAVNALNVNAHYLAIACVVDSPLKELCGFTLEMPWAFDESVCQTRCVSNMYSMGAMVIGALFGDDSIREGIRKVAECGPAYLEKTKDTAKALAELDWDHAVVLADGEIDGLAEEAALTYKEISQLNSNYYHVLDVRHGPMVLVGKKTLLIAAVKAPTCPYEMALVDDAIAHGAYTVCYSATEIEKEGATCVNLGAEVGSVAYGLGLVALCQMISYFKSQVVGCDPDQPDGLSPWIKIG